MDKPCPRCHSMSLNSSGQSKFLCGSVRRDNGRVDQSMICTRIERLEAKLERYEQVLQSIADEEETLGWVYAARRAKAVLLEGDK